MRAVVTHHYSRKLRPALSLRSWIGRRQLAVKAPGHTSTYAQARVSCLLSESEWLPEKYEEREENI